MTASALAFDVFVVSAQIACVIAVAAVLARAVRIDAASVRYQYWRGLLLFCLLLPWLQRRRETASAVEAIATIAFPATAVAFAPESGAAAPAAGIPWLAIAMGIVLAGIAIRLARVVYGVVRLRGVRQGGQLAPANTDHDDLQRALGTQAEIRYVSDGHPVTCGLWRPVVLLPEHLASHPDDIQRAVLAHELLHVKRRDWLWVIGEEVLRSVLWFHPGIWWLVGRVRLAREEVVDELTVCVTGRRRTYLEALLAFADAAPFTSAAFARRRHLFRRMTLISKEAVMSSRRIALSCAVLVFGVVAGSWYAVEAFPLAQAPGVVPASSQAVASEPGPLERSANTITPENPIPRRTYSVMPPYPRGASGSAVVIVRLTINTLGQVGEVRPRAEFSGNLNVEDGRILADRIVSGALAASSDPFVKAGIDAVRQWVYAPPADGALSFDVGFFFEPGTETRLISYGGPLASQSETAQTPAGVVPPPPPPPPPPPWTREGVSIGNPVRVGGDVKPPVKVSDVKAVYPPLALAAHVQGTVTLEAVVGTDGRVNEVRVLNSAPMFDQAAMDAVKEWRFTPGTMNGVPVPVIVTMMVSFTLK